MRGKTRKKASSSLKLITSLLFLVLVVAVSIFAAQYILMHLYPQKYSEYVEVYAEEYGIETSLVYSIIKAESGFDPDAVSPREAKGLMQIMDSTGEWAAEKISINDFETSMLMEPETNIRIGCWYIARLLKQYDMNADLALAAYNAGSGNVSKWLNDSDISSNGKTLDRIPFEETKNYIDKIKKYNKMYKKLYDTRK